MRKVSTANIIFLIVIALQTLVSIFMAIFDVDFSTITAMLLSQAILIVPFVVYVIATRQNPLQLIRFKKVNWWSVLLAICIGIASYPVMVCLNMVSMLFVDNVMVDTMAELMPMGFAANMALLALTPAIVEETLFRGVIYNTYSNRKPLAGIFLSAFLFGIMHMNFNQMPYTMFLGIILALTLEACDSIIGPMIVHFTINGGSTILSFLTAGSSGTDMETPTNLRDALAESYRLTMEQQGLEMAQIQIDAIIPIMLVFVIVVYAVIALVALVIVSVLIYVMFKVNKREVGKVFKADHSDTEYIVKKNGKQKKNRLLDVPAVIVIVYGLLNCVLSLF